MSDAIIRFANFLDIYTEYNIKKQNAIFLDKSFLLSSFLVEEFN